MQWNEALDWSLFQVLWIIFKSLKDFKKLLCNNWWILVETQFLHADEGIFIVVLCLNSLQAGTSSFLARAITELQTQGSAVGAGLL